VEPTAALDRRIWSLAGPAALTLLAQPLYLLADTAIVARVGPGALGSLAVAATVLLFATGVLVFLTFGTAATVARELGAGDLAEADALSVQSLWLAGMVGFAVAGLLAVGGGPVVDAVPGDGCVAQGARTYLGIAVLGVPATCLAMAGTGALRGHLDTRTPLAVTIAANTLNVVLDLWLVIGLERGLAGSATGTVVAQWAAAGWFTVATLRRSGGADRRLDPLRLRRLAVVGRDLFVRTVALRAALTLSTVLAARRGAVALAAYQVAFQWFTLSAYLLDALEAAAQSLVGRALGGGAPAEARAVARRVLAWSVAWGVAIGVVTVAARWPIARFLGDDPAVAAAAASSLLWVGAIQPVSGPAYALDGVLVGAGDQRYLARAMVVSLAVIAVLGPLTTWAGTGLWGLWLSIAAFMASRAIVLGLRLRSGRWALVGSLAPGD
jgi:putative MATE family efflux protein